MKRWLLGATLAGVTATGGVFAADEQTNPYEDKGTHYELPITSDIPQGERVEIAKDKAEISLIGWNDEYNIKISPQIPTTLLGADRKDFVVEANRPLLTQRMEYKSGDVTAFIEPKSANEFDIDFTLDSKPDTNVFEYKIEGAEEFDFFYQPELTAEEIAEGADRPENVIGSYAVYHKTKANHRVGSTNYATGKAFHIYRPKAIDANGAEVWAVLAYADGVLSVAVPQKFLEEAVYPVVVDPTFGYTTIGGSTISVVTDQVAASFFTGAAGTATTIQWYCPASGCGLGHELGIFLKSDNTFIEDTGTLNPGTAGAWNEIALDTTPAISAVDYWLAHWGENDTHVYDTVSSAGAKQAKAFPGTWGTFVPVENDERISIYATYTADAPPAAAPADSGIIWFSED